MQFASAAVTEPDAGRAVESLARAIKNQMDGQPVDLALLFFSPHFSIDGRDVSQKLRKALKPGILIGCTGEGVIGRDTEIERQPAMTLLTAHLPGVDLIPFALYNLDWEAALSDPALFRRAVSIRNDSRLAILLADPFSIPLTDLLTTFNTVYPGLPLIGGAASGVRRAGGNVLLLADQVYRTGAVGLALAGEVEVDIIVSQGCRPLGDPLTVTGIEHNVITGLDGEPPLRRLQTLVSSINQADHVLLEQGLFVGRAINPARDELGRGDFLIRNVLGFDPESGAIAIADHVHKGEIVQFHVRDAQTAREDLEMMLATQTLFDPPAGAFLFSCNGRGTNLYAHPDGDISTIQETLGGVNLAGFFAAGEIGPIGGTNFLHGHTVSMALLRPAGGGYQLKGE